MTLGTPRYIAEVGGSAQTTPLPERDSVQIAAGDGWNPLGPRHYVATLAALLDALRWRPAVRGYSYRLWARFADPLRSAFYPAHTRLLSVACCYLDATCDTLDKWYNIDKVVEATGIEPVAGRMESPRRQPCGPHSGNKRRVVPSLQAKPTRRLIYSLRHSYPNPVLVAGLCSTDGLSGHGAKPSPTGEGRGHMKHWTDSLKRLEPCPEAVTWANGYPTLQSAWDVCEHGEPQRKVLEG